MAHPAEMTTTGPIRKISMAEAPKNVDVEKGLDDIRKEVIEGRNLIIKTDNLLKTLHAELKAVGKQQEDFKKRQWISSGVAYGVFAVLCVAGGILISNARTSTASAEQDRLTAKVTELQTTLDKQAKEASTKQLASNQAQEVYKLMTTLPGDERLKGIDALRKLDLSKISMLEQKALEDRAELLRKEIGQSAFERGKAAFRRNDMNGTIEDLSRFLAMNPSTEDMLDASFFLGAALNNQRKHADAIAPLARFVEGDKRSKQRDYAMLLLAQSYDATNQFDKAADTAREGIQTYPNSEYLQQFKNRLSAAKRGAAEAAGGAVQQANGQPQQIQVQPVQQVQQAAQNPTVVNANAQVPAQQQKPAVQQQPAAH